MESETGIRAALAMALGLVACGLSNVGMGVQKRGAPALARLLRGEGGDRRGLAWWFAGTGMTVTGSLLLFPALGLGRASVIAPLEGAGLAALAVYATCVLGESLTRRGGAGLALIAGGTALVGIFGTSRRLPGEGFSEAGFAAVAGAVLAAVGLVTLALAALGASRRRPPALAGVALGASAGSLAGLAAVLQKVLGEGLLQEPPSLAAAPHLAGFALTAGAAFCLLQWAHLQGRAVEVVPSYASAFILVPAGTAPLVFGEPAHFLLRTGMVLVVAGVLLVAEQACTLQSG